MQENKNECQNCINLSEKHSQEMKKLTQKYETDLFNVKQKSKIISKFLKNDGLTNYEDDFYTINKKTLLECKDEKEFEKVFNEIKKNKKIFFKQEIKPEKKQEIEENNFSVKDKIEKQFVTTTKENEPLKRTNF